MAKKTEKKETKKADKVCNCRTDDELMQRTEAGIRKNPRCAPGYGCLA